MTLLELTVVLLVLLAFIGTLIISVRAWTSHSDRTNSIVTIRNSQQAVRGYANTVGKTEGTIAGLPAQVFGAQRYVDNGLNSSGAQRPDGELPEHPVNGESYDFVNSDPDLIPPTGTLYICTGGAAGLSDPAYNPVRSTYEGW